MYKVVFCDYVVTAEDLQLVKADTWSRVKHPNKLTYQRRFHGIPKFLSLKYCRKLEQMASLSDRITLSCVIQDAAGAAGMIALVPRNPHVRPYMYSTIEDYRL